jgi:hypothetical protein
MPRCPLPIAHCARSKKRRAGPQGGARQAQAQAQASQFSVLSSQWPCSQFLRSAPTRGANPSSPPRPHAARSPSHANCALRIDCALRKHFSLLSVLSSPSMLHNVQRHAVVGRPLRSVGSGTQLHLILGPDLESPRQARSIELLGTARVGRQMADEMHLLHSLSCTS